MSEATAPETESAIIQKRIRWIRILERFGVVLFLIVLIAFFTTQNIRFIYPRNLFNILADVSIYGVMAVGMTLVILTAGIDLSVGAILAFAAMSAAAVLKGTGESRAVPEDPMAFGGYAWLVALAVSNRGWVFCGWVEGVAVTLPEGTPFFVTPRGVNVLRCAATVVCVGLALSGVASPVWLCWRRD